MTKTIGKMLRVALFAAPLALPGAALAQSAAGTPSDTQQQQMNAPAPSGQEAPAPQGAEKDKGTMGTDTQAPPDTTDTAKKKEQEKKHQGSSGDAPQGQQY